MMNYEQTRKGANFRHIKTVVDLIRKHFNEQQMKVLHDRLEKRLHFNEAF